MHKMKFYLIFILGLLVQVTTSEGRDEKYLKEDYPEKKMAPVMNDIAVRINKFNFNFNEIVGKGDNDNTIFSPFSIYTALAMLGVGAKGKTKMEIASVLESSDDDFLSLLKILAPLFKELSCVGNGSSLDIANKAWVGNDTVISPEFQKTLMQYFDVELGKEDFSNDPALARKNINDWVEKVTENNIKDLFSQGSIGKMTRLVLANAIYFKGEWEKKFDDADTYEDEFYITKDKKVMVKYMFLHDKFSKAIDKEHKVQILQLPYTGGVFNIIFVAPLATEDMSFEDLNQVEASIKDKTKTLKKWIEILPDMKKVCSEIDIMIPKFELKLELNLLTILEKLGVNDVFVPGVANLSGINEGDDLYVSSAVHKAFIKIDEEGTTAAAATGLAANTYCMDMEPQEFVLNHPFLFYIVHKDSNSIIFSGKVQNPSAE